MCHVRTLHRIRSRTHLESGCELLGRDVLCVVWVEPSEDVEDAGVVDDEVLVQDQQRVLARRRVHGRLADVLWRVARPHHGAIRDLEVRSLLPDFVDDRQELVLDWYVLECRVYVVITSRSSRVLIAALLWKWISVVHVSLLREYLGVVLILVYEELYGTPYVIL